MRMFLHLLKYNFIFNKVSLAFLSVLALFILGISSYFIDNPKELGTSIMQYSMYVMFIMFTGKMNSRNSMMFDIKYLLSLPLTKTQIIYIKSLADTVQFLPVALVFLYGFSLGFPEYHTVMAGIILFLGLSLANIIAFSKRIDFSRMQHSKASFKNSFLFFHKYLEMFIQIIIVIIAVGLVMVIFEKNTFMLEYSLVILMCIGVFFSAAGALKMLKDETRSYFIYKRDLFRISWKVVVVAVPLLSFHSVYKKPNLLKNIGIEDQELQAELQEKASFIGEAENKTFLLTLLQSDEKGFFEYLKNGNDIPWETDLMGSYPPHLAAVSGNLNILSKMIEIKPEIVNLEGKYKKKTPLFSAIRSCKIPTIELLINKGAYLNHQDIEGNTPVIYAAQRKCYGAIFLLKEKGADLGYYNKENKTLADYIPRKTGLHFTLNLSPNLDHPSRSIASEEDATLEADLELLQQGPIPQEE